MCFLVTATNIVRIEVTGVNTAVQVNTIIFIKCVTTITFGSVYNMLYCNVQA